VDTTLIALIRGINVGRAKRVAMADLRAIVEDLGYRDVRTLLNSGNIVFTASGHSAVNSADCIEAALSTRLTIVDDNPLGDFASDPSRLLVAFLRNPEDLTRLDPLLEQDWKDEVLALGVGVAYLWCPNGIIASRLVKAVGRVLGDNMTTLNWATVMKLNGNDK